MTEIILSTLMISFGILVLLLIKDTKIKHTHKNKHN